jgi:hypothetical protein
MPSLLSHFTSTYTRASDLPESVLKVLRSNARNANVILPPALKIMAAEQSSNFNQKNIWITCASQNPPCPIEFVLSCAEGYMGSYPLFILTTLPVNQLTDEHIRSCVQMMAQALKKAVPIQRVYSVFAPEPLTEAFVAVWTRLTGIKSHAEPYYAANITYCTRDSFVNRQTSVHPSLTYEIRPAIASDINEIADLCFQFAEDSVSNHNVV